MSLLTWMLKSPRMLRTSSTHYPARRACAAAAVLAVQLVSLQQAWGMNNANTEAYIPAPDEVVLVRDYPLFQIDRNSATANDRDRTALVSEQDRVSLIRKILMHGLENADSESLGYAQGLLNEWSDENAVPSDVRLFRAMIAQQQHQFEAALYDLNQILTQQPNHHQARLVRSSIYLAMGDYASAEQDCRATALKVDPLITANCLAQTLGSRGQASVMLERLKKLLTMNSQIDPILKREVLTTIADLHLILNEQDRAESAYLAAIEISPHHPYLNAQYCELLVQREAYAQLADFLASSKNTLNTRVYQAVVDQFIHPSSADQQTARDSLSLFSPQEFRLDSRRRLRKELETLDLRDDADTTKWWTMYFLYIEPDATQALHFARQNWQHQKSLPDARLLYQAAIKSETEDARQALSRLSQWLDARRIVDHTLRTVPVES